jgi:putative phosphoribosyl transferase
MRTTFRDRTEAGQLLAERLRPYERHPDAIVLALPRGVLNEDVLRAMPHAAAMVAAVTAEEAREVERRERDYRQERPAPELDGRVVILVDDGLATGATMLAAIAALRQRNPAKIVVAVPVCPPETKQEIERTADEVVILLAPEWFRGVGQFYENFAQLTDEAVCLSLARAAGRN